MLNVAGTQDFFYNKYLKPQIEAITSPLHNLSPLEEAYFCRMMTFVLREQMISKVGAQEGTNTSSSDLWTMPLAERKMPAISIPTCTSSERNRAAQEADMIPSP